MCLKGAVPAWFTRSCRGAQGRAFLPLAEWSCQSARRQGREKNTPIHFLTRYAWENSPRGHRWGFAALCFSVTRLHISYIVQLWAPTRRTATPQAHPQEADNSVDVPVAAEEVASVRTNKQSTKVHSLGGCQAKFDLKYLTFLAFVVLFSWDVSPASYHLNFTYGTGFVSLCKN